MHLDDETADSRKAKATDPRMLDMLVCPFTKTTLVYDRARSELVSRAARLAFPIKDGIPMMLEEFARPLGEDE